MNVCIHFQGREDFIAQTMAELRKQGIPFLTKVETMVYDKHGAPDVGAEWKSSDEIARSWEASCKFPPLHVNSEFYGYFRERDVAVAIIMAKVHAEVWV